MRTHTYIGLLLLLLVVSNETMAQWLLPDTVCTGTTSRKYYVTGWPGSTYTWTIAGGAIAPPGNTDTITVNWTGVPGGIYSITVSEHAQNGCSGEPYSGIVYLADAPHVTFARCFDSVTTTNAKPIRLNGGVPLGGAYSGPGVSTGYFYPDIAGPGIHQITYTCTNIYGCSSFAHATIHSYAPSIIPCGQSITDIRDNKVYPTIQLGNQCWLAANLNYGTNISSALVQLDNCIAEKYCYHDFPAECTSYGGLYQWDEMMKYDNTPAIQGLCLPGWHVPTETEWDTLFNFYQGEEFAGRPLQDTTFNGFKALKAGVFYLNSSWNFNDFATLFWSSTSSGQLKALSYGMNKYNNSVSYYPSLRVNSFSIRCLKD